jgi:glycosyltransferase involved in cell wall biosynthesis
MRVVFYTHPFFLEPALHFVREMAERCELHVILEMTPRSIGSLLATTPDRLPAGLMDADPVLAPLFPAGVRAYWSGARSFRLAVFTNARTVHPATVPTARRVLDAIDRLEPDAVHLDDGSLRLALAYPWLPPITLLNVHDPIPHGGDPNRRLAVGRRLVARRVSRYRVHAEVFREPFATRARVPVTRIDVAPLGVYDILREWVPPATARATKTVLFAGRIAPYKGLDVLYAAAPRVAERVRDVRFVVAGRAVDGYRLPSPPPLPNGGRIDVIAGHVPNESLARLHAEATVVACPYRDATQSGVIMTAYAFGTPVVASAVGGLPEYVDGGTTGLLVPPGDEDALADALVTVLRDRATRERLADGAAAARHGRLGWPRIADLVMTAYRTQVP